MNNYHVNFLNLSTSSEVPTNLKAVSHWQYSLFSVLDDLTFFLYIQDENFVISFLKYIKIISNRVLTVYKELVCRNISYYE